MSALKNATGILGGYTDMDAEEKRDLTLDTAREFERYITGEDLQGDSEGEVEF